jgi:signal transduction histidine kinase
MTRSLGAMESTYALALRRHVAAAQEETLHAAYELGRDALASKIGVLQMTAVHFEALLKICKDADASEDLISILDAAGEFARESFSPYEMAHRGIQDANEALRRINDILEEQMQRIARELHDEAGQLLASVHLALQGLAPEVPHDAADRIAGIRGLLDRIEEQLRRISHELRPIILDDLGLVPALRFLGDGISQRSGIPILVVGREGERLPPMVETALYRIVQEALTNSVRHARASRVEVTITHEDGRIRCAIQDNGIGFDPAGGSGVEGGGGLGLVGIRERLVSLSGTLDIQSGPNQGTGLLVTIPLEKVHA